MMNKFAILGDTHFGARDDSLKFHNYFARSLNEFFDWCEREGITTVFQLGDLWDRRKYINYRTLLEARKYFFDEALGRGIDIITLLGNHDIAYKNTLRVNSTELLIDPKTYPNVTLVKEPTTFKFGGESIDLIPWICDENEEEVIEFIKNSESELCMGHFEIAGFAMYKGNESKEGLSHKLFQRYEMVFSGHYHTKSQQGNIMYVGTPYEITWQDWNDPRGWHSFDISSRDIVFCQNPYTMFEKIVYSDTPIKELSDDKVKGKYVKVVVAKKSDSYKFEQFVKEIERLGCYDVKVVDTIMDYSANSVNKDVDLEDTLQILKRYVDGVELEEVTSDDVKQYIDELHTEAVNSEMA